MNLPKEIDHRRCKCGHSPRVHSKLDGRCLGGTEEAPMSCKCKNIERPRVPRVIDAIEPAREAAV